MKSQYTVKEINEWENETFNYVLHLTEEEAQTIARKCEELGQGKLSITKTDHTIKQILMASRMSSNTYMKFIWTYELEPSALENWKEFGDCFYKGLGLKKLTKKIS